MGIYITFRFENSEISEKLDLEEGAGLESKAAQDERLRQAHDVVFGESADGVTRRVKCGDLSPAITMLLSACKSGLDGFTYSVVVPPGFVTSGTSSGVGGLRVGEKTCAILGGFDHCTLITYRPDGNGGWVEEQKEDARNLASLKTDNFGVVRIRKRAVPSRLTKTLKRIQKGLALRDPEADVDVTVG